MGIVHFLVTSALLALILRWLWKAATSEKAKLESGRQIYPPTKLVRVVLIFCALLFGTLAVASVVLLREPRNWWVPYFFLAFVVLVLLSYPPILTIDVDGLESRNWLGKTRKIRWEEIANLHYNRGNRYFTIRATDGRKVTHSGFNADADAFREEIQRRTRLPVKISAPGLRQAIEVPYAHDQVQPREDDAS